MSLIECIVFAYMNAYKSCVILILRPKPSWNIYDIHGQGSVGAALVSSLNIGVAIKETFTDQYTANIGQLPLDTLIF